MLLGFCDEFADEMFLSHASASRLRSPKMGDDQSISLEILLNGEEGKKSRKVQHYFFVHRDFYKGEESEGGKIFDAAQR